jgi:hypothetical protein
MPKPIVTIEQWGVVRSIISQGFGELNPGSHLMGHVFGHARLHHAKLVYTSAILSVDFSQRIVETANTLYRLGEPSDEYKSWYDKQRTLAA